MAKKQTPKKIYTDAELDVAMIEIPKVLAQWRSDPMTKNKVGSLYYATMKNWNKKGEGIKTLLKNKKSAINNYIQGYRNYPNAEVLKLIERLKEEYIKMGGNLNDLKTI